MWACQDIAKAKRVIFQEKLSHIRVEILEQLYVKNMKSEVALLGEEVTDCKHLIVISGDEIIVPNCSIFNLKYMQITGSQTWPNMFLGLTGKIILVNVIQKYFAMLDN